MTTDPLAPVERLLDDLLSEAEVSAAQWLPLGRKVSLAVEREAVRLLLDHARALDYAEFSRAYDALLAFAARLEGERS